MTWTKRQIVEAAFDEIGLASYMYDLDPSDLQSALRKLDAMMATWNAKGVRLGYPIPTTPENADLDEESGVPDSANEAIYMNLAIRIAGSFGKTVTMETKSAAKMGYQTLLSLSAKPIERQFPDTMPSGAGNKPWRSTYNNYLDTPVDLVSAGDDANLEI